MNTTSTIQIDITLDEQKMPAGIAWQATGKSGDKPNNAKAMLLAFWDKDDKTALRIDLWTKDMMVDEMTDFFTRLWSPWRTPISGQHNKAAWQRR